MEGDTSEMSVEDWLSSLDMQKAIMWNNNSLPENLKSPPYRIPTSHPHADQINKVLEESLLVQSSTIPNKDVWYSLNHFIISNSCMAISGFLAKYLTALGVSVKIVHGVLKFPKHPEGKKGIRHVFLDVDGQFVDNTYMHMSHGITPEENFDLYMKFCNDTKHLQNYSLDPKDSSVDLLHGSDAHVHGDNVQYVENSCSSSFNANKFLAFIKKSVDLNPGPQVYDNLMRNYLKEEFDVIVPDVSEEMDSVCWNCEAKVEDLKTCTGCKTAKYCNKECLAADWNIHKIAHKMKKNEQKRKAKKDFYASLNDDSSSSKSTTTTSTVTTSTASIENSLSSTSTLTSSTSSFIQLPSASSIPSPAKHTATLIFLHGLGDTGTSWASTLAAKRPPHVKVVCPHAEKMPVTLNGGMNMPSWFDLKSLDPNGPEDEEGIKKACLVIIGLIQREMKEGIPSDRIILGGFSQGGALALYTALNTDLKLGGVVGLSCWLPLHVSSARTAKPVNLATPFLQCHGDSDPVVPHSFGLLTATLLKSVVKNYQFETYQGLGHSSCATELHDVNVFLAEHLSC